MPDGIVVGIFGGSTKPWGFPITLIFCVKTSLLIFKVSLSQHIRVPKPYNICPKAGRYHKAGKGLHARAKKEVVDIEPKKDHNAHKGQDRNYGYPLNVQGRIEPRPILFLFFEL